MRARQAAEQGAAWPRRGIGRAGGDCMGLAGVYLRFCEKGHADRLVHLAGRVPNQTAWDTSRARMGSVAHGVWPVHVARGTVRACWMQYAVASQVTMSTDAMLYEASQPFGGSMLRTLGDPGCEPWCIL